MSGAWEAAHDRTGAALALAAAVGRLAAAVEKLAAKRDPSPPPAATSATPWRPGR
jgi:hypothetical protein